MPSEGTERGKGGKVGPGRGCGARRGEGVVGAREGTTRESREKVDTFSQIFRVKVCAATLELLKKDRKNNRASGRLRVLITPRPPAPAPMLTTSTAGVGQEYYASNYTHKERYVIYIDVHKSIL